MLILSVTAGSQDTKSNYQKSQKINDQSIEQRSLEFRDLAFLAELILRSVIMKLSKSETCSEVTRVTELY